MRRTPEIERAVTEFARAPNSGLILTGGTPIVSHRELIAALAAIGCPQFTSGEPWSIAAA